MAAFLLLMLFLFYVTTLVQFAFYTSVIITHRMSVCACVYVSVRVYLEMQFSLLHRHTIVGVISLAH